MGKKEKMGITFMVLGFGCLVFTGVMLVDYRILGRPSWFPSMLVAISAVIEAVGCWCAPNILLTSKIKKLIRGKE